MDSNFKINKLYLFSNLTISQSMRSNGFITTFIDMRTDKVFNVPTGFNSNSTTELFFISEKHYQHERRTSFYSYHFLTDLFMIAFYKSSQLIRARDSYDASLILNKKQYDAKLKYNDRFVLKVQDKKTPDILIANFNKSMMEPIFNKYNKLFDCL